jgi:hypothetical protein
MEVIHHCSLNFLIAFNILCVHISVASDQCI